MQLEILLCFFFFCVKSNFCPSEMWKCAFKRQLIFLSEAFKFIMTDKCFTHKKVSICYNVIMPFTYVVATTFASKHIENAKKILLHGILNPPWKRKFNFLTLKILNLLHAQTRGALFQRKYYTSLRFYINVMFLPKIR